MLKRTGRRELAPANLAPRLSLAVCRAGCCRTKPSFVCFAVLSENGTVQTNRNIPPPSKLLLALEGSRALLEYGATLAALPIGADGCDGPVNPILDVEYRPDLLSLP